MVLPNFKENLAKYAKLLVSTGINVQPGHTVQLTIGVEQAELARLIVKEAYAHGAKEVLVNWLDDVIARERLVNVDVELLEQVHPQRITEMNYLLERKASRLVVLSEDPGAYDGVDPEKLSRNARALSQALNPMRQASQANKISWTLGAASGLEWAKKSSQMQRLTKRQWTSFGIKSSRLAVSTMKIQSKPGKSMKHVW